MSDIKPQFKGMLGVFLVCAELSKRNLIALPTSRNAKGYDIVVLCPETNVSVGIQIKCSDRKDFPILATAWRDYDQAINDKILCPFIFVDISDLARPRHFILSQEEMKRLLKDGIEEYKRHYARRHGITFEEMVVQEETEKRKPNLWAVKLDKVEDYENKWQTLTDRLK